MRAQGINMSDPEFPPGAVVMTFGHDANVGTAAGQAAIQASEKICSAATGVSEDLHLPPLQTPSPN
jgi:hypothetical protein